MLNVMEKRTMIVLAYLHSNDDGVGAQGNVGFAWSDQLHNVCNTKCLTSF